MEHDTFEIKNAEIQAKLHELGKTLKDHMPPGFCFTLLLAEIGHGGAMFYISSAERDGALESMKEFLVRQGVIPKDGAIQSPFVQTKVEAEGLLPPVEELQAAGVTLIKAARGANLPSIRLLIGGVIAYGIEGQYEVIARKLA